jgi:hypothetical protein
MASKTILSNIDIKGQAKIKDKIVLDGSDFDYVSIESINGYELAKVDTQDGVFYYANDVLRITPDPQNLFTKLVFNGTIKANNYISSDGSAGIVTSVAFYDPAADEYIEQVFKDGILVSSTPMNGASGGSMSTDLTRVGGNLPTTVTEVSDVFTINFSVNNNFLLNANGAYSIAATISAANVGQSGMITIVNTTATAAASLPSNLLTSNGLGVAFDNTSGHVSVLSYYVISSTQAIVNYVGNFS